MNKALFWISAVILLGACGGLWFLQAAPQGQQQGSEQSGQQGDQVSFKPIALLAPTASGACNGAYGGTFRGNLTVSNGQSCTFTGGGVTGNVTQEGGNLVLANATVGGNIQVTGGGTFAIGPATTVNGNVQVSNLPSGSGQDSLCSSQVHGDVQFANNKVAVVIGSSQPPCAGNIIRGNLQVVNNAASTTIDGNTVGGNLQVDNDAALTQIIGNTITGNLQCQNNSTVAACTNTAAQKQGQCAPGTGPTNTCVLASPSSGFTALYPPTLYFTGTPAPGVSLLESSPGGVAIGGGAPPAGSSEATIGFAVTISAYPYVASGTFNINAYLSTEYPNSAADVGSIASISIGGQPGYEFTFQNEEGGGQPVAVVYHNGYVYELRYASTNNIAGFSDQAGLNAFNAVLQKFTFNQ